MVLRRFLDNYDEVRLHLLKMNRSQIRPRFKDDAALQVPQRTAALPLKVGRLRRKDLALLRLGKNLK